MVRTHFRLIKIANIESIIERANFLNKNYLVNCFNFENELINDLVNEYIVYRNKPKIYKTFLCSQNDVKNELWN